MRHNLDTLVAAIEDCRDQKRILPSLILLYSGIDIVGSLEQAPGEPAGAGFRRWATRYVLSNSRIDCSADDLWGARCAIVHTYTAESEVVRSGRAKQVFYTWGTANVADLADMTKAIGRDNVALHINDVVLAFKRGVSKFLLELASDPARLSAASERAGLWFTNLDESIGDRFLRLTGRKPDV